ncbi:MAG: roadblock/LC7 domain-containing protein [Microbacteriaceae bacterium]|nr:roadblock/LC7 domain-containing protein [Microbacteriaceae bacterium]
MSDAGRFDPALVAAGTAALDAMKADSPGLVLAVLISDDGFEVVRTPRMGEQDGRFASMASSVQALSEAVIHELQIGKGDAVIIQAASGVVIQQRVPGRSVVLSALFRTDESLGRCLVGVRNCTAALDAAISALPSGSSITL